MAVTKRQKGLLEFFGILVTGDMSAAAAGREIGRLMSDRENAEEWSRYVSATQDFGIESDKMIPFAVDLLGGTDPPADWAETVREWERREARGMSERGERLAADVMAGMGPYDSPQPEVVFPGRTFVFTGKFEYGERKECQAITRERGGVASKGTVAQCTDYLVIGSAGSPDWSNGKYGRKIEKAIVLRGDFGAPAIISEEHWVAALGKE